VTQSGYQEQFTEKLGFEPYDGTLNVRVTPSDQSKLDSLRRGGGIVIKGFEKNGRTFGDVRCYPARIQNIDCAIAIPSRSHYNDVMEIVCRYHLRRTLGLKDGDMVEVRVSLL
jgi:riboflavin kinase